MGSLHAPEEPFLTVIDAGALKQKIEERLQQGIEDQEIISNLDCYQQVNLSFDEIDEVIVINQGAYPAHNQPISFEDYTLPLQLDEDTTVYTNRGVNLANSKLYSLVTSFLFEDESGKTTLVALQNSVSRYIFTTPRLENEFLEARYAYSHLQGLIDVAYAASIHPEFAKRIVRPTLGGSVGVIPLSVAEKTMWTDILRNEAYPLLREQENLRAIELE